MDKEKKKAINNVFVNYFISSIGMSVATVLLLLIMENNTNYKYFYETKEILFSISITFAISMIGFLCVVLAALFLFLNIHKENKLKYENRVQPLVFTFKRAAYGLFATLVALVLETVIIGYEELMLLLILATFIFNILSIYSCLSAIVRMGYAMRLDRLQKKEGNENEKLKKRKITKKDKQLQN